MAITKRWFVEQSFEAIGLASYVFDLPAEALQSALHRLDSMMASWSALGIRVGWPVSPTPGNADLDQETPRVPVEANEAIYLNLARRIAPAHGKTLAPETLATAREAYSALLNRAAMPQEMQMPGSLPRGAGQKSYDNPFVTPPDTDPLGNGANDQLIFNG